MKTIAGVTLCLMLYFSIANKVEITASINYAKEFIQEYISHVNSNGYAMCLRINRLETQNNLPTTDCEHIYSITLDVHNGKNSRESSLK